MAPEASRTCFDGKSDFKPSPVCPSAAAGCEPDGATIEEAITNGLNAMRGWIEHRIMAREHHFTARLVWTGAAQGPTRDYESYSREYRIEIEGKPPLAGSSDPTFRGDASKHNPEDLLVASLSGCHMLSYLHLCASAGIEVVAYEDQASGKMALKDRKMRFVEVMLAPKVTIVAGDPEKARALHEEAHAACFIANSVNFLVLHTPTVIRA